MTNLEVIVPVYNEESCLETTFSRLCELKNSMNGIADLSFIFVDDGSADKSLELLKNFANENNFVKVLSFSRNFGHQTAVWAGIENSNADFVAIIDADLQDPPELIKDMFEKALAEDLQVVYGKRTKRKKECICKKLTASIYYRLLNSLSSVKIPNDTGDFRLIRRDVVEELKKLPEKNKFLRGMIPWLGFKSAPLEYVRDERLAGKTKYTLAKMFKLAGDGIYGFSSQPVHFISVFANTLLAIAVILFVLGSVFRGAFGFFFYTGLIIFVGSIQLYAIAILGQYIVRIWDEAKNRPVYVLKEKINL